MAPDTFTETTHESWGSRLKNAVGGILFGLVLVAVAFVLLFWNEGRAVERHRTLQEGAGAVVAVQADRVDPSHEGALVHVTGPAETDEVLRDEEFGVAAPALRLERRVEMYQWQESKSSETEKKVGGGTETTTTYSYDKGWSDRAVDSGSFRRPEGHENPGAMPWQTRQVAAERVNVGAFRLSPSLVRAISRWQPLAIEDVETLPEDLRERARLDDGGVYVGDGDPGSPQVGDVRVSFRVVEPTDVSVVAGQSGGTLQSYRTEAGGDLALLELGTVGAEEMFEAAERANVLVTWGVRFGGFLLMAFGFSLIMRPLSVAADLIPAVGSLVGVGTGMVSFLLAAFLSLLTIAVAWIFYRPLLAAVLIALAVATIVVLVMRARKAEPVTPRRPAAAAAGESVPPPPPPPA